MGRGSSVGITTCYVLDPPGIKSWLVEVFHTPPVRSCDPSSLLYCGYRNSFPGVKLRGCGGVALTTHHLAPRLKKKHSYTYTSALRFHGLFQGEICLLLGVDSSIFLRTHAHPIGADSMLLRNVCSLLPDYTAS